VFGTTRSMIDTWSPN